MSDEALMLVVELKNRHFVGVGGEKVDGRKSPLKGVDCELDYSFPPGFHRSSVFGNVQVRVMKHY